MGSAIGLMTTKKKLLSSSRILSSNSGLAFHELKDTFGPTIEWLGGVIKDAFASLDKFLGNDDGGVKGLRIALESLFAMSLLAGLARLGATSHAGDAAGYEVHAGGDGAGAAWLWGLCALSKLRRS